MFNKKNYFDQLLAEAFSAQKERIETLKEDIVLLRSENDGLKKSMSNLWEIMSKMDSKLTDITETIFGKNDEGATIDEYKLGE